MGTRDPRVDAYIARSADFARPILERIRAVVHAACPDVEETLKWSMPHFGYKGMMCGMAAFKEHATLGFWKASLIEGLAPNGANGGNGGNGGNAMGNFGRLTKLSDLPPKPVLARYVKAAMRLNEDGIAAPRPKRVSKPAPKVPPALQAALARNKKAAATFASFPPSHRREYIEWIGEAKREETKARRIAQAVEWIAAGKSRNWRYERA